MRVQERGTDPTQRGPYSTLREDRSLDLEEPFVGDKDESKAPPKRQTLRRMFQYSKKEWRMIVTGTIFLAIGGAAQASVPYLTGQVIDSIQNEKDTSHLHEVAIQVIFITIIGGVALSLRGFLYNLTGERVVLAIKKDLYNAIVMKEMTFFDHTKSGELANRLSSDTTLLQSAVSTSISVLARNIFMLVVTVIFLLLISPKLTLIMFTLVPFIVLVMLGYGRFLKKNTKLYQDALAQASTVAVEALGNPRTVRSFAGEVQEMAKYRHKLEEAYSVGVKRSLVQGLFGGVLFILANGLLISILWYGGAMVIEGEVSTGDLAAFLLYTVQMAVSLTVLGSVYSSIMQAIGAAEKIFQIIDEETGVTYVGGQVPDKVKGEIVLDDVSFQYPSRAGTQVIENLSFQIEPESVVALVGPSGGGKSTVVQLLQRFYEPIKGKILMDGIDIRNLNRKWYHKQIGYVSQEPVLFSGTIEENIGYGMDTPNDEKIREATKFSNAYDFITNKVQFPDGFRTLVGERGIKLSGGQKQRVSIARAIVNDPKILLLDEATSALDAESEHSVQQAIDSLVQRGGKTVLIIAHRLSTVKDASKIMVMKDGNIAESGTHEMLLRTDGIYKSFMKRQLQGGMF
eukprot:CAMPEP_0115004482 /NCGR_PEP_ID=MMETSP0216-20121206/19239_1 /TAXON_ID=223996 /ORGANISM="Protocruzia adherens, Strain Boccale" /LENGTH=625 /DNA_ID=CAMNT_0002370499 /DNA_START=308 /DNA_END=2185 /DNA_ORIENTATION=-